MSSNRYRSARAVAGISLGLIPASAFADFTPNGLAVLTADTSIPNTTAVAVRVQQFAKTGTLQTPSFTVTLPSSGNGTLLTMSGDTSNNSDGALDLSYNGRYLSVAGYNQAANQASVTATTNARILGRIDSAGNTDLTTSNSDLSALGIRTIASADGSQFWFNGSGGSGQQTTGGVFETSAGSSTATTIESGPGTGLKTLHVFNGQLYGITNNAFFWYPSPPLPTALETRTAIFSFTGGASDFYLLDRDPSVAGLDTLYLVGVAGVKKYSFDGASTWTQRGSFGGNFLGVAAEGDATSAKLYLVDGTNASANTLISLTDNSAFNVNLPGTIGTTSVTLATAAAGTEFRNVEFTPVPEPASIGLLLIGAAGTVVRRRKSNRG